MPRLTFTNENEANSDDLDATDIMLLQFPELWDNTRETFYDVYYYGAEPPEAKIKKEYKKKTPTNKIWSDMYSCRVCGSGCCDC